MARYYQDLLDASHELLAYDGYLSTARLTEKNQVQATFDAARRAFVYDLFKEGMEKSAIWPSVSADLDEIDRANPHAGPALDYVREQLERHIGRQMGAHPIVRFAIRWGPPAGTAIAVLVYFYLKLQPL